MGLNQRPPFLLLRLYFLDQGFLTSALLKEPDSSLLWGAVLCFVGCLTTPLASIQLKLKAVIYTSTYKINITS